MICCKLFKYNVRTMNSKKLILVGGVFKRTAIVPSKGSVHTLKRRRRRIKNVSFDDLNIETVDSSDVDAMEFKVKQLQEFTRNLREQIKIADSTIAKHEAQKELIKPTNDQSNTENDSQLIYGEIKTPNAVYQTQTKKIGYTENLTDLILASESDTAKRLLPDILRDRINDDTTVLACLLDNSFQNWNGIISKLYESDLKLKDIPRVTLQKHILSKVSKLSLECIEKLDRMLLERVNGDITRFNTSMYECLFLNLAQTNLRHTVIEDPIIKKMRQLLERWDRAAQLGRNSKMSQFILNNCIKYATKIINFEYMNFFLTKFKDDYSILPNKENYTTVIQFYTKVGASKQVWDTFDTMKFLSQSHSPDLITYNSVLHQCSKDKDYAKAIDVYHELQDRKLEPSVQTLTIMAKIMAKASADPVTSENKQESLRLLGWKYIHQIEEKMTLNKSDKYIYYTLNAMMALAAYDGDTGLTRALYFKYCSQRYREIARSNSCMDAKQIWKKVLDPELFNYLLLSYANHKIDKLPLLLGYDQGIKFRRNILNSVDYSGRSGNDDDIKFRLPMLPILDLNHPSHILSESRALWHFNLEYGGSVDLRKMQPLLNREELKEMVRKSTSIEKFKLALLQKIANQRSSSVNHNILNTISLTSFLTIPIKVVDKREFCLRLNEFTFQQQDFEKSISKLYNNLLVSNEPTPEDSITTAVSNMDVLDTELSYLYSMQHKILSNCTVYELIMKAAAAFGDVELASKAWRDRGEFRKTKAFNELDTMEKAKRDSDFAALMVQFFASQKSFSDALGIIMTSQKYIDWKYPMIRTLHKGLIEIEDEKSIKILLSIVNRKSAIKKIDEQIQELKLE